MSDSTEPIVPSSSEFEPSSATTVSSDEASASSRPNPEASAEPKSKTSTKAKRKLKTIFNFHTSLDGCVAVSFILFLVLMLVKYILLCCDRFSYETLTLFGTSLTELQYQLLVYILPNLLIIASLILPIMQLQAKFRIAFYIYMAGLIFETCSLGHGWGIGVPTFETALAYLFLATVSVCVIIKGLDYPKSTSLYLLFCVNFLSIAQLYVDHIIELQGVALDYPRFLLVPPHYVLPLAHFGLMACAFTLCYAYTSKSDTALVVELFFKNRALAAFLVSLLLLSGTYYYSSKTAIITKSDGVTKTTEAATEQLEDSEDAETSETSEASQNSQTSQTSINTSEAL